MNNHNEPLLATHTHTLYRFIPAPSLSIVLKGIVGSVVALPFFLSTLEILLKESLVIGAAIAIEAVPSIFRVGYIFYGQHVMELFAPQETIAHIAHHLSDHESIDIPSWSISKKILAAVLIMLSTLPLGITKIGLNQDSSIVEVAEKSGYLLVYSMIDALPHINHLPFWQLAVKKFLSLPLYVQAWVLLLMGAHALNDVADIWNSSGMLTYWIYLGLTTEFFISGVEAVAHYHPESLKFDAMSMANMVVIILGSINIALLNWYNTFDTLRVSLGSTSKLIFGLLQSLATVFFAFEVWNHYAEPACDDHDDHHGIDTNSSFFCLPPPPAPNTSPEPEERKSWL